MNGTNDFWFGLAAGVPLGMVLVACGWNLFLDLFGERAMPQEILDALTKALGSHAAATAAMREHDAHRAELHAVIDKHFVFPSPTAQLVEAAKAPALSIGPIGGN